MKVYKLPMLGKKSDKVKRIQLYALKRTIEIPQSDDGSDEEIVKEIDEEIDEELDEELDEDIVVSEISEESGEGSNLLEKNDTFLTVKTN